MSEGAIVLTNELQTGKVLKSFYQVGEGCVSARPLLPALRNFSKIWFICQLMFDMKHTR